MPKLYNYTPKDDLTIQELSDIMKALFVSLIESIQSQPAIGSDDLQVDDVIFNALPNHLKRHFSEFKDAID